MTKATATPRKRKQALKELIATGGLTSNLCRPLGIPFEAFLKLAQLSQEKSDHYQAQFVLWAQQQLAKEGK